MEFLVNISGVLYRLGECVYRFFSDIVFVVTTPDSIADTLLLVFFYLLACYVFASQPHFFQRLFKRGFVSLVLVFLLFWPGILFRYVFEKIVGIQYERSEKRVYKSFFRRNLFEDEEEELC